VKPDERAEFAVLGRYRQRASASKLAEGILHGDRLGVAGQAALDSTQVRQVANFAVAGLPTNPSKRNARPDR
jgi:hypothetical protein